MPLPKFHGDKKSPTSKKAFMQKCMSDKEANKTFPDQKQRAAYCYSQFEDKKKKASLSFSIGDDEFIVVEDDTGEESTT